jgi:hypothetical protein
LLNSWVFPRAVQRRECWFIANQKLIKSIHWISPLLERSQLRYCCVL